MSATVERLQVTFTYDELATLLGIEAGSVISCIVDEPAHRRFAVQVIGPMGKPATDGSESFMVRGTDHLEQLATHGQGATRPVKPTLSLMDQVTPAMPPS